MSDASPIHKLATYTLRTITVCEVLVIAGAEQSALRNFILCKVLQERNCGNIAEVTVTRITEYFSTMLLERVCLSHSKCFQVLVLSPGGKSLGASSEDSCLRRDKPMLQSTIVQ